MILRKLLFHTLITFFFIPFSYLYADTQLIDKYIELFHYNVTNFRIGTLKPENYNTAIKKNGKDKKDLKQEFCGFWLFEEGVNGSITQTKTPVGFNIHWVSDKPKMEKAHILNLGCEASKAIKKWKSNKGKYWDTRKDWYKPIKSKNSVHDGYLNIHACIELLKVDKDTIKDKICLKCHIENPEKWISCYRFYFPDIEEYQSNTPQK